jgi:DNA-binding transcriptional LysR family regulator
MDRLLALQAFARVVELGGFTKAGDSLQLSKTTVSDLVQGLENHLGVRLLQRTTRRVSATSDGAAFYERCAHILAELDEAEAGVISRHPCRFHTQLQRAARPPRSWLPPQRGVRRQLPELWTRLGDRRTHTLRR